MIKLDVDVDVSDVCQLDRPLRIAATAFLPERHLIDKPAKAVFALPGGLYSRGYFDMHFPGHTGYSQAEYFAEHGIVLVAIDHLGVGESSPEVAPTVRFEDIAAANNHAVREIAERLGAGTLTVGYPAVDVCARIGIGQSLGGAVTVMMAASHQTYDAIAVLGQSAIHHVLPMRDARDTMATAQQFEYSRDTAPNEFSLAQAAEHVPDLLYPFFWDEVPADIIEKDISGGYPLRTSAPSFGSVTFPNCALAVLTPGFIKAEAAAVDVPVFIAFGERDAAPLPHDEPSAYPNSPDVSLFICERMAHMHNFAPTRHRLWDRLAHWCVGPTVRSRRVDAD